MNVRTTLILLLVLALFAGLWWLLESGPGRPGPAAGRPVFPGLRATDVLGVSVEGANALRLERVLGGWQLHLPDAAAPFDADPDVVEHVLLAPLERLPVWQSAGKPRPEHRLDPPELAVALTLAGGARRTLALGAEAPLSGAVYARLEGESEAALVDGRPFAPLRLGAAALRSRRVFPFEGRQVTEVELGEGNAALLLTKSGTRWLLRAPREGDGGARTVPAEGAQVDELVNELLALRVREFPASPPALERGLRVRLRTAAREAEAVLAEQQGGWVARAAHLHPAPFPVTGAARLAAGAGPGSLRDRRLLGCDTGSQVRIRRERAGESIEIAQEHLQDKHQDTRWRLEGAYAEPVEGGPLAAAELARALCGLQTDAPAPGPAAGEPELRFRLVDTLGIERTLLVFPPAAPGGPSLVQAPLAGFTFEGLVPAAAIEPLRVPAWKLAGPILFRTNWVRPLRLVVEKGGDRWSIERAPGPSGEWIVDKSGDRGRLQPSAIQPLLAALTTVETQGPVGEAPADRAAFGLEPPLWRIAILDSEKPEDHPIRFDLGRQDAEHYACLQGRGPIHKIAPALFSELQTILR